VALLMPFGGAAFAQAGSTGGTIGKEDKSVSGTQEPREPNDRSGRAPHQRATASPNEADCARLVGTWSWPFGSTTFSADHTMRHSVGNHGTWSCKGRDVTLTWADGVGVDLATFTAEGTLAVHSTHFGTNFTVSKM
jgi:hypothetical protein